MGMELQGYCFVFFFVFGCARVLSYFLLKFIHQTFHVRLTCFCIQLTATGEIVETSNTGSGYVDVGYISSVHGIQGEIRVKSNTDFPELRFSKVKLSLILV